jgi:hypothetical protein
VIANLPERVIGEAFEGLVDHGVGDEARPKTSPGRLNTGIRLWYPERLDF